MMMTAQGLASSRCQLFYVLNYLLLNAGLLLQVASADAGHLKGQSDGELVHVGLPRTQDHLLAPSPSRRDLWALLLNSLGTESLTEEEENSNVVNAAEKRQWALGSSRGLLGCHKLPLTKLWVFILTFSFYMFTDKIKRQESVQQVTVVLIPGQAGNCTEFIFAVSN